MMKLKDILQIMPEDINKMNQKDITQVVNVLNRTAKNRVKSLKSHGYNTPAMQGLERSKSGKGKPTNLNEYRAEYKRLMNFINAKSSTVRGAQEIEAAFQDVIDSAIGKNEEWEMTEFQEKKFWDMYNKLDKLHPELTAPQGGSQEVREKLIQTYEEHKGWSKQKIIDAAIEKLYEEYEKKEAAEYEEQELESSFYDIWGDSDT